MANGNGDGKDPLSGLPWWVKAIVIVGVPGAIALGLVWSDRVQLMSTIVKSYESLVRVETGMVTHDSRVWLRFDELSETARETNRILLAQCVNNARDELARERCVGR